MLFEATQALEGTSQACQSAAAILAAPGMPCELGKKLVYGEDFIASYQAGSNSLAIVPLKVLNASQGHLLVVTESLKDLNGRPIKGSGTWDLVRQDISTNQVGVDALVPLQKIVNQMVDLLDPQGVTRNELSYGAYFTTQSTGDSLAALKRLAVAPYAQALQQLLAGGADLATAQSAAKMLLPSISTELPNSGLNAFEALKTFLLNEEELSALAAVGLDSCQGLMNVIENPSSPLFEMASSVFSAVGAFCATSVVHGQVDLPYYLDPALPKTGFWQAACTSGATLNSIGEQGVLGLIQAGQMGVNNALCQLASGGQLYDLDLTSLGMEDPRYTTRFNPIPLAKGRNQDNPETPYNEEGTESLNVHITVPNEAVIAAISAASGGAIPIVTKPETGWPVVIFQHGITGNRTNVLPLSGALSLAGFATVSIDHPLHGDRGLVTPDGEVVNASQTLSDYLNFSSLLTGRDNARQSSSDIMGLRLALNTINDATGLVALDPSKVNFIAHSLGSITGVASVAIANEGLDGELSALDSMFKFNTAVLNVPAGGIPSFILESDDFGPLVKGGLLSQSSMEFAQFLNGYASSNGLMGEAAIRPAFKAFFETLTPEQLLSINSTFAAFGFAAQTILDSADPVSFASSISSTTPILSQLLVGGGSNDDGTVALADPVNPIVTSLPLVGGQPLADLMGLSQLSSSSNMGGVVRFLAGDHFSLLVPNASAQTTAEMQSQAVSFFLSQGQRVEITNTSVVEN